jgi:hypothetical protein
MPRAAAGRGFDRFGPEEYELVPDETLVDEGDGGDGGSARGARLRAGAGWILLRLAWIGLAALLSLGSAGIVAATGKSATTDGRPELTYGADQALSDQLDAGVRDLTLLSDHVTVLSNTTREVLADLSQVNQIRLQAAYQQGDTAVAAVTAGAASLGTRLACKPWPSSRDAELAKTYSQAMVDRWREICGAVGFVATLSSDWASMENGANVAMEVANDISAHDSAAGDALQAAKLGRFPDALTSLQTAAASLADAQRIDADLAKIGDVSTLTEWLSRTKTVDDALGLLWQTMIDTKGRVTIQVTAALQAVNEAQALLPANNSVLQVVLYELAGNLTADGISIETAKGQLAAALGDLTGGMVVGP